MFCKIISVSVPCQRSGAICPTLKRFYSEEMRMVRNPDPAQLKRGTGGRSSFNGKVVTVFGGTGYLGRHIVSELGRSGAQIIIPYRCNVDEPALKALKLAGDLGQILFQPFHLRDMNSIKNAVKYSNVVINVLGKDFETKNFNFYQVFEKGARDIALACKELNVERLIHFSSLHVTEKPAQYYLVKAKYLPFKLKGEQAVLEEFPDATIFRPGTVYGMHDTFLTALCSRKRCRGYSIPLYKRGEKTIKQPVYVADITCGVAKAIDDPSTKGKIIQGVGPEKYYLKDIAIYCNKVLQRDPYNRIHDLMVDFILPMKIIFKRNIIGICYYKPKYDITFEAIERESTSDCVDINLLTLKDLNVPLTKIDDIIFGIIYPRFKASPFLTVSHDEYKRPASLSTKALTDYDLDQVV